MNCVIKIEITDKEIIGILPNKTVKENLTSYTDFIVIKDGIFLITDVQKQKNVNIAFIPTKTVLHTKARISQTIL